MNKAYVIAEIGSNHNKNLKQVYKMIDVAVQAGVDAVKTQTFYPSDFVSEHITPTDYGLGSIYSEKSWREVLEKHLILPFEWYEQITNYLKKNDLDFIATIHSKKSLDFVLNFDPKFIKIASMDLTNTPLLQQVATTRKPLILSLGMSKWADIERAVELVTAYGCKDLSLLHCVSTYPADYANLNLNFLKTLTYAFPGIKIGFSDHSLGTVSSVVAVVLGAKVIEKHFTLDRSLPGPDHPFSLEPNELVRLVTEIRQAEKTLGSSGRIIPKKEYNNRLKYQRSLVAKIDLKSGKRITLRDLLIQRPGDGIPPYQIKSVLGKKLKKTVRSGKVIHWEDL